MESKRTKMMEENEDRISSLPDCLIQHIISFLPSTKQAIQTSILSKRWQNQWTRVPVLIFDHDGMSSIKFLKFVENALVLHDCSKIKKFHLEYYWNDMDDQLTAKIRFATRKNVEDLKLRSVGVEYMLPKFIFDNASLVKLTTHNCNIMPNVKINWECLTELDIDYCNFTDEALERIISGSPLLQSLELSNCDYLYHKLVIASKTIKRLVLLELEIPEIRVFEISCPNLEELYLIDMTIDDPKVFGQAIESALFCSSLLESFQLIDCREFQQVVIASKSLKNLVLGRLNIISHVEISCPNLEFLKLYGCLNIETAKLLNLPTSVCATFNFYYDWEPERSTQEHISLIKDILRQLQHVKELKFGNWFVEILSAMEAGGLLCPVLNTRCLTLKSPDLSEHSSGIARLLCNSPMLEELVIKLPLDEQLHDDLPELNDFGENYWKLHVYGFYCLASHLKTIQIIGYPKRDDKRKFVLNFVQFLLKNARVLEKMVLQWKDHESAFSFKVSQELLSLTRCSQHATIELLCSK